MNFSFEQITSLPVFEKYFALRYQVYCLERGFLPASNYRDEMESDKFDITSLHLTASDQSNTLVGSARLVLDSSLGFPLEEHYTLQESLLPADIRISTAEISRLIISKRQIAKCLKQSGTMPSNIRANILQGLFKQLYQYSKQEGVTHWLAAMEDSLVRLLRSKHIQFTPVGPHIDYYGKVRPYIAEISQIEAAMQRFCPEYFMQFTSDPDICPLPQLDAA